MTVSDRAGRRRWPWFVGVLVSIAVLIAAVVWLAVAVGRSSGQAGDVGAGVAGLVVAVASLAVSALQLRHAHRATPPAGGESRIPAGSRIRQDVTASVPGAIAQGVIGGDINNRFERPDTPSGQASDGGESSGS